MALAMLAGGCALPAPRYNVILIVTDDQRWDTLEYMPILQRELVARGITFTNAFVTTPHCCPSRASILTGLYAHNHGVKKNAGPSGGFASFNDESTLATWLHDAGYRTGLIGKYLNRYKPSPADAYIPPGWDTWLYNFKAVGGDDDEGVYYNYQVFENGRFYSRGTESADYSTDFLAQKAVEFIRASGPQPFFLYFATRAPHAPATPAPRHIGRFDGVAAWRPPSFNAEGTGSRPPLSDEEIREIDQYRQDQLESLLAVDEAIETIVEALRQTGKDANTVILYTSDHGVMWGEHRATAKQSQYLESLRVPLVIRYPWAGAARLDEHFVLNIDLAPTIAEIAGATLPAGVDGVSLLPLIADTASEWREDFLFELWGNPFEEPILGVISNGWSYVRFPTGGGELYNLMDDPYQLHNLFADTDYAEVKRELGRRLKRLLRDSEMEEEPTGWLWVPGLAVGGMTMGRDAHKGLGYWLIRCPATRWQNGGGLRACRRAECTAEEIQ